MKKMWCVFALAILVLALAACSGESGSESGASTSDSSVKPAVAAKPTSGSFPRMGVAELDQYLKANAGKPTMLFFWATWCPSCKQEIPELEKFQETHGDRINLIALSMDDKVEALEKYTAKHPVNLPVYWGDQAMARKFRVEAIPTLVIFDKTGKQVFSQAGIFPHSMLGAMADNLTK